MPRVHVFAEVLRLGVGDERMERQWDDAADELESITDEYLEEIRKIRKPTPTVRRVMEAVHLILNAKPPENGSKLQWDEVHKTFTDMSVLQRVRDFDMKVLRHSSLRPLLHVLCRDYLGGEDALTLTRARHASVACGAFFSWSVEVGEVATQHSWYVWDVRGNPLHILLEDDDGVLKFGSGHLVDYCNVLTRDPVRSGAHFVEFVMHRIGDEQWCGVTDDPRQAGSAVSGRNLHAWSYYCGRRNNQRAGSEDHAALHADKVRVQDFHPVKNGDAIRMLLDVDQGALVFLLNGEIQGACPVPSSTSLYFMTHLDEGGDSVELRELPMSETPEAVFRAAADAASKKPASMKSAPLPLHKIGLRGAGAMVIMAARNGGMGLPKAA